MIDFSTVSWFWLEVSDRFLLVPGHGITPIWPFVLAAALVAAAVATRKRWMVWRHPKLTGDELARWEATKTAIAELLSVVEKPRRVRRQLEEPLAAYRKALHRTAQLRRYLALHTDDLEATIHDLQRQRGTRRADSALAATETRVRARARALDELDALELELVHLESMMWATVENRITRGKSDERQEVRELLQRIKASEDARTELDHLDQDIRAL